MNNSNGPAIVTPDMVAKGSAKKAAGAGSSAKKAASAKKPSSKKPTGAGAGASTSKEKAPAGPRSGKEIRQSRKEARKGRRAERKASRKEMKASRKASGKDKTLKRVGKALLTGGASEAHKLKKKAKKAIKGKIKDTKSKVKAKIKDTKSKVKSKVKDAAKTVVAGMPMYGGNKGDESISHKDYEGAGLYEGPGGQETPKLGSMSDGAGMYGKGSKISYGNYKKPTVHKGSGKAVHGSPFNLQKMPSFIKGGKKK